VDPTNQSPKPSIWPIGFAIGIVCVLVGFVLGWPVLLVGVAVALACGALWARDAAVGLAPGPSPELEPGAATDGAAPPASALGPAMPVMDEDEIERYDRGGFLSAATIGLGGLIGAIVTVPVIGFMVAPAFVRQHPKSVDLGPIDDFPEGQFVITTFLRNPAEGEVTRRTAYIRNNGIVKDVPSFTIISNRCAHLGCPVQPNGPVFGDKKKTARTAPGEVVSITPTIPAGGFGCPCHGGQYDTEGNRKAGPPVRALDRYEFSVVDGHLVVHGTYSVSHVEGAGASAIIHKSTLAGPGEHIDGPEQILYPVQPPH
jgi:quinol---cytochrome c reductase iron-sulfur subunit, bacillus type